MRQVLFISGKGGTGKTSVAASIALLYENIVVADCDVDAPDLHILLKPEILERRPFLGSEASVADPERCTRCGACAGVCRFGAVSGDPAAVRASCEGCGVCSWNCPEGAITMVRKETGETFLSAVRCGAMAHACLEPGGENSGKLVTEVKRLAVAEAERRGAELILIDGPPGIGCPVIASLSGAGFAVAVAEPTVSGMHDLKRVVETARHFKVPVMGVINKFDLNPGKARMLENYFKSEGIDVIGRIPYSRNFVRALMEEKTVVSRDPGGSESRSINEIRDRIETC